MSWPPDGGVPADDEPLGRPFLDGGSGRAPRPPAGPAYAPGLFEPAPAPAPPPERHPGPVHETHRDEVRPYVLTGGRTAAAGPPVAMETVVVATGARSARGPAAAGRERAQILHLADQPCSAAEVAAHLHLPLQVALVLVTDLVAEGLLDATAVGADQADDVMFLERLIAGVAAL